MIGRKNLRAQLEESLRQRSILAAEKSISSASIDGDLKYLDEVDRLLKFIPKSNKNILLVATLVGAACLIIASLLWTLKPRTVHLQLTAAIDGLTLVLAKDLEWSGTWNLSGGLLRVEEMSKIELPPELTDKNLLTGHAWLEIKRSDIQLKHLFVGKSAQLSIARNDVKMVDVTAVNAAILGELQVVGSAQMEAGDEPGQSASLAETSFEIPGTVTFSHGSATAPSFLRTTPKGAISFSDVHVKGLTFAKENEDPEAPFVSAIKGGKLTIAPTGEKLDLEQGSRLRLKGAEGIVSRLVVSAEGVDLSFEGEAQSAKIGPAGLERELKPSWLEYLYHQQRLGFFWAAATFLWGLLWSARTLIFK